MAKPKASPEEVDLVREKRALQGFISRRAARMKELDNEVYGYGLRLRVVSDKIRSLRAKRAAEENST